MLTPHRVSPPRSRTEQESGGMTETLPSRKNRTRYEHSQDRFLRKGDVSQRTRPAPLHRSGFAQDMTRGAVAGGEAENLPHHRHEPSPHSHGDKPPPPLRCPQLVGEDGNAVSGPSTDGPDTGRAVSAIGEQCVLFTVERPRHHQRRNLTGRRQCSLAGGSPPLARALRCGAQEVGLGGRVPRSHGLLPRPQSVHRADQVIPARMSWT